VDIEMSGKDPISVASGNRERVYAVEEQA